MTFLWVFRVKFDKSRQNIYNRNKALTRSREAGKYTLKYFPLGARVPFSVCLEEAFYLSSI